MRVSGECGCEGEGASQRGRVVCAVARGSPSRLGHHGVAVRPSTRSTVTHTQTLSPGTPRVSGKFEGQGCGVVDPA